MAAPKKKAKKTKELKFDPTPMDIETVELLAGHGLTKYLICGYFGVCKETFAKAERRNPELKMAFKRGQAKTIDKVAGILMKSIERGCIDSAKFYLRTRGGWSEKYDPNRDETVNEPYVSINVTDPNEAAKIYQQIMKGEPTR